jgi:DNA-binding NtrC family response regulator
MPVSPGRILIADDQIDVLKALRLMFKSAGYEIHTVTSPAGVMQAVDDGQFDLALIDLNYTRDTTSGNEGLDLLASLQALDVTLPVVVMTAWGNVELAVEAMRRGARDFIEKPWNNERLLAIARAQTELSRALRYGRKLEQELRLVSDGVRPTMLAESRAMHSVLQIIARVSGSDANVLITGENGTGKGLLARVLHANSTRAAKPLVTVDAASLSETVFESELFGHVRGAYTDARSDRVGRVELADGGTIFFDEIGNVPLKLQGKLLRVVETGEFEQVGSSKTLRADVRFLAATNSDLGAAVAAASFRQDLLFRLNTVEIRIPALRERVEDIPLLATHFLVRHARRYRKEVRGFDAAALRALAEHPWPGNVRELDHAVERAVLMTQAEQIGAGDLLLQRRPPDRQRLEDLPLEEVERVLVQKALDRHGGNVSHAAAALGLSRTALYRRLEKYGLLKPGTAEG